MWLLGRNTHRFPELTPLTMQRETRRTTRVPALLSGIIRCFPLF